MTKISVKNLNGEIIKIDKFLLPKEGSVRTIIKIIKTKDTNINNLKKIRMSIIKRK